MYFNVDMIDIAYSLLASLHRCLPTGRYHAVPHSKKDKKSGKSKFFRWFFLLIFFGHFCFIFIYLFILFIYLFIYVNTSFRKYKFVRTEILGIFKSPLRES